MIILLSICVVEPILAEATDPKNLTEALAQKKAASKTKIKSESVKTIMSNSIQKLQEAKIEEGVIQKESILPDAALLDPHGKPVKLQDLIKDSPAIITFYRGGWCPYCNIQLQYYQKSLSSFEALGAKLIAISPESPENALNTIKNNKLTFTVLSDKDNQYAQELGLVFTLPSDLTEVYNSFGIDLNKSQGNSAGQLPLSASFVVDAESKVVYRFIDADYKNRAPEEELLAALQSLNK